MTEDDQIRAEQTRAAWARIELWLKQHAPRNYAALPPPCTEEQVRAHEQRLDAALPADVRALYLMRNGTGSEDEFDKTPTSLGPLRSEEDRKEWEQWDPLAPCCYPLPDGLGIYPLETRDFIDHTYIGLEEDPKYLPLLSAGDVGVSGQFIDMTSDSDTYGQLGHYFLLGALPEPGGPTLAAYLTTVADAFEAGQGRPGFDGFGPPPVVNGRLDWDS
ncbi:SMI1/KNR4 family protein [Streptomyces sp. NPDC021093]|uniref:SMI1/KNR4 family protein n=1 Tax=Streptomyces sp. NPDC021093 TaxID=3365112 RepID=UPI0037BC70AD